MGFIQSGPRQNGPVENFSNFFLFIKHLSPPNSLCFFLLIIITHFFVKKCYKPKIKMVPFFSLSQNPKTQKLKTE